MLNRSVNIDSSPSKKLQIELFDFTGLIMYEYNNKNMN
jgi:hypothetical protein